MARDLEINYKRAVWQSSGRKSTQGKVTAMLEWKVSGEASVRWLDEALEVKPTEMGVKGDTLP